MILDGSLGNVTTSVNALSGIAFLVAAYFLRDFVQSVRAFMRDIESRVQHLEDALSLSPDEVGSFAPLRRKVKRHE